MFAQVHGGHNNIIHDPISWIEDTSISHLVDYRCQRNREGLTCQGVESQCLGVHVLCFS